MDQHALLEDLLGRLVKFWGVVVCPLQNGLSCRCDGVISECASEWARAYWCLLGEIKLLAVNIIPDCLMKFLLAVDFLDRALRLLHLHLEACPTPRLAKGAVEAPPETPVLFPLNDSQNLTFCLLILFLLGGLQAAVQVLTLIVFTVLPEVVTLTNAGLESEVYFLDGERHGVQDIASPCRLLEVALVLYPSCMEPEERLINLHPTNPQRRFRGE
jgi:hypothetical protein